MRILFMGTPDFALYSLRALLRAGEHVVGVVTQPDKPRGRGYDCLPPPVKREAQAAGIPVFQPATLKNGAFDATLSELAPDVIVVTAYGKILPPSVLSYPRYGCINVHASLLPAYRGAAPMQRAIMAGAAETGVTIMQMDEGLDTGDMLLTRRVPIGENDNLETVHDRLGEVGAEALLEALSGLRTGSLRAVPQDSAGASYAEKIGKADCVLDFTADAVAVHDRIRALSPTPLAFTRTPDGKLLKVVESRVGERAGQLAAPGTVLALTDRIVVACGTGTVEFLRALPEGKGRMAAADYIRGRRLEMGDCLGD